MSSGVKLSEAEFSTNTNKLTNYTKFLTSGIETYIKTLDGVLSVGIEDAQITAAIKELQEKIKPIATELENIVNYVQGTNSKFVSAVEKEDNYKYSDEGMSSLFSALSMFL
jgi:hypothetical protein